MEAKEHLHNLLNHVWNRKVNRKLSLQLKQGLLVTSLPKGNLQEAEEDHDFAIDSLAVLKKMNKAGLSYEDQLNYAFLQEYLLQESRKVDLWWAEFPVTPYTLYWMNIYAQTLFAPFSFQKKDDMDRYLHLLHEFGDAIYTVLFKLQAQAKKGWYVPIPALPKIIELLIQLQQTIPALLTVTPTRLHRLDKSVSMSFSEQVDQTITNRIVAAYQELLTLLQAQEYQSACPERVGIGQYPGGEEAYRHLVRMHVTYDIEPDKIHLIGLDQVRQLTEKMRTVRESLGFQGSEAAFMEHIKTSGRLYAKSPEDVEQRYHFHLNRLKPLIHDYFHTIPKSIYQVKRLDAAYEASVAYGYFDPPSSTNPIGTYYYNGSGLETRSQLTASTLIYHEIIPGHHLQIGLQLENQQLPAIRRESMELTGYLEGWAEYGAGLPYEMGLAHDPYDWYGRLLHERFIAQRLVVDTGMNVLDWSLQQAKEYMAKTTIESAEQIEAETLRYSTESPAQALAYRLGYLKFRELREKTEKSLGSLFDRKDYHEAILSPGSLPLYVLEEHIDHFIKERTQ
ncbi:DUF885 domain-containing protein [Brevibacillus fluminis]|uniref:DUF885 domain-containing protein n=1 Tax=Brevibacillus fluminis TaxID=511487 RepID=A0A3M8D9I9_9BACL|nr:DUF885 domain-containing protein [Brevibacillus fluminis]RNB84714.1 DUF885 domain-containing protein [Brevibacillus fluminis]